MEGEASPADVVLTVDIGRLRQYADKNLFATFASDKLLAAIPPHLRSSDNTWFGFSKRSRVIAVSKILKIKIRSKDLKILQTKDGEDRYVLVRVATSTIVPYSVP